MFVVASYYSKQQNHSATKFFLGIAIGSVNVGNTKRNEDIIVVVKVIVIGQFLSFENFHQWTGTYVPTSPCSLKLVRTSPTV